VKFAAGEWLFGMAFSLLVAALLVLGGVRLVRALKRFGEEPCVEALVTARAGARRVIKGSLMVIGVAFAFLALSQPQYGQGTRLIPATNLDVVLVLDYSKSMHARDITPSRIARAKAEVGRLIGQLPGARFAAVAFAGEPMSFPLTSDGAAIAQFLRQLAPNDMPVGGTAIGRALEAGRELLRRDPLSDKHRRVVVLITDGEDLEGDPVASARAAQADQITIFVVQIGGRTPEPIPEVDDSGRVIEWRTDASGAPLTTSLSAEGEAQLTSIAEITGGFVVRAKRGSTGIDLVASRLKELMSEELSERVETVYADVYMYPLGLALLLLIVETFVPEARRRKTPLELAAPPPAKQRRRRAARSVKKTTLSALAWFVVALFGCEEPSRPFTRYAPPVDEAIAALDAGDAAAAVDMLSNYLSTGRCEAGNIGTPEQVAELPNAGFDLGLGLFRIAEQFGQRFGDPPRLGDAGATPEQVANDANRRDQVECALRIVRLIAGDATLPVELRARAFYLVGNLEFLRSDYRAAVDVYDQALRLIPGMPVDAGDPIGRDAAHNRAVALRRIEDEPDASPPDAGPDAEPDPDAGDDSGSEEPDGGNDAAGDDAGSDAEGQDDSKDAGGDDGGDGSSQKEAPPENEPAPDAGRPPPSAPNESQDERMLDMLEQAPTLQEQEAKNRSLAGRRAIMEDK
jgi:Ca-activated chloride channel family protein